MNKNIKIHGIIFLILIVFFGCKSSEKHSLIQDVEGIHKLSSNKIWLSHEHILVDFSGADSIQPDSWDHDLIIKEMLPYLEDLKKYDVSYFVDATPDYLGRDAILLKKLAKHTGIRIITNTGFYGANDNKYVPGFVQEITAEELAEIWINEYQNGIRGTLIKPGFIKIAVDNSDPLSPLHEKIVKAAALTHLKTGLIIASHTGKAKALWPQLSILKETGVSPEAFIWVHAQAEEDNQWYLKAAETGCWISFDGLAGDLQNHVDKVLFAKENGILNRILLSQDAGWYDPRKEKQNIKPYTTIFEEFYSELMSHGFTDDEFNLLTRVNPSKAFSIKIRDQ